MSSSPALLAELADGIGRAKFDSMLAKTNTSCERSLTEGRQLAEVIGLFPLAAGSRRSGRFNRLGRR
jgi:hypothetical protein